MPSLKKHLEDNSAQIAAEAIEYAKSYGCSIEIALRDVRDEYVQGYCEGAEASRTTDWDFGQE